MKVIPSAMVSSKLFSVSANTAPFRGGKATVKDITYSTGNNALGLQKDKSIILNAVMPTPRSHKTTYTTCISQTTQKGRAVASEGQRFITGP